MDFNIYDSSGVNILFEKEFAESFYHSEEGIRENTIYLEHPFGKGSYKEICFEGVAIGFGNMQIKKKMELSFESNYEIIEMHFSLKGKSNTEIERFDKSLIFEPHQHNLVYSNSMCGKINWECDEFIICEINLSPAFFKKFIPQDMALFDKFRNDIEKGKSSLLSEQNNHMSNHMYQIINEIIHCQRQGTFKRIFLETKVLELLLLQFEQFSDRSEYNTSLKKSDINKMYSARDFMLQNLASDDTLIDLAHNVGTNEFTLKKGFKELFGTTVFAFWNDTKMEQAKLLLMEKNMNINEIARIVGYKNQTHFSVAFKKKFGMIPSQLKKS